MSTLIGRLFSCIVCQHGSETWGGAVYHMTMHLNLQTRDWDKELEVARILTTISMHEEMKTK